MQIGLIRKGSSGQGNLLPTRKLSAEFALDLPLRHSFSYGNLGRQAGSITIDSFLSRYVSRF